MKHDAVLKFLVIAMLLPLTPSSAHVNEWSGHVGGLIGGKILDDADWPDLDSQFSLGSISDIKHESWPISMALDFISTGDLHKHDDMKDFGHTIECHLGVRKIFGGQDATLQPYIGGGVAFMRAGQEFETNAGKRKQNDNTVGGWIGAGMYYTIYSRLVLGVDVRYSQGSVTLFDRDIDAGGVHTNISIGFKF